MKKKIKVENYKIIDNISKKCKLIEAGQGSVEIKFALLNKENGEVITPFCKCKDYFNDVFWSNKVNKDVSVYGFNWKPNQDKGVLLKDTILFAIRLNNVGKPNEPISLKDEDLEHIRIFINKFERKLKFSLSIISYCNDKTHMILEIDKKWFDKPYLISALLLLIRLGIKYEGLSNPIEYFVNANSSRFISPNDQNYFKRALERIKDLYNGKIDNKQNFEMYNTGSEIHNNSGIVNYKEYSI